jgi:hypothetical protein
MDLDESIALLEAKLPSDPSLPLSCDSNPYALLAALKKTARRLFRERLLLE